MLDPSKTTVVLGAPGCGKTTRLIQHVEESLSGGLKPHEVGFISFTKQAAEEGKQRTSRKLGINPDDLRYFRTLHSLSFSQLHMRRESVLGWSHLRELGEKLGIEFKGKQVSDDDVYGMGTADRMLFLEGYAKNTRRDLRSVWEDAFEDSIDWFELERFARGLEAFKKSRGLYDYNDMLERFIDLGESNVPRLKVLIVDEAQDCSLMQWEAIELLAEHAEKVFVGGDDQQAIYTWSGANVERFIGLGGTVENLEQSYRIPGRVHSLSEEISAKIKNKRPRTFRPRDEEGSIGWFGDLEEVDLSSGTWLLIARNGYMLEELEEWCMTQGFSFHSVNKDPLKSHALASIKTWEALRRGAEQGSQDILDMLRHMDQGACGPGLAKSVRASKTPLTLSDLRTMGLRTEDIWHQALSRISRTERDYFLAARKRGEPLLKEPRIRISTIHRVKGGEAEHVLLLTDMSYRCYQNMERDPDSEHRVFYVGTTRAKKSLNLIVPRTNLSYEM